MDYRSQEKLYESLSPFELKNKLISMAQDNFQRIMLNAGRGNPNWIATSPREAYFSLGKFALEEARLTFNANGLAGTPNSKNMGQRLLNFCSRNIEEEGSSFLKKAYLYATEKLDLDGDTFIGEMVDGILGDHYPTPSRILNCTQTIVRNYLNLTMFDNQKAENKIDIYATEGGTAAMTYIFNSLKENFLLSPGDKIALGTPIFTPYLEIPELNDYELVMIKVEQDEDHNWQYPTKELEKLKDPSIKAFFLVNPSNPSSVSISEESMQYIANLVKNDRKDLIILTDDVYGTFVKGFRSLASIAPKNTILVYSYSKYFGTTGWRLGVIAIDPNNIMDDMLKKLPKKNINTLNKRYKTISTEPENIKFIDRIVADSRAVALNHTAGLSTPQQVMMALLSFQELLDSQQLIYRQEVQNIIHKRYSILYNALGYQPEELPCYAKYYTTIDIPHLALERYGKDFKKWLQSSHEPIDFVWRLAQEKEVVLMDGGGFAAPQMSIRVSLANLEDEDYAQIGKAISDLLSDYHREWKKTTSGKIS